MAWLVGFCMQASFDRYLENKPRVFKAIFPDKRRSQQLNEVFVPYLSPLLFSIFWSFPLVNPHYFDI